MGLLWYGTVVAIQNSEIVKYYGIYDKIEAVIESKISSKIGK